MCQELQILAVIYMYWCAGLVLLVFVTVTFELLWYMILILGTIITVIIITFHVIERSTHFFSLSISNCLSVSSSRTV